jgi:hypothetical protein
VIDLLIVNSGRKVQEIVEIRVVNDTGKQQYLMMEVWWVYQFLLNNPTEPNNVSEWTSFSKKSLQAYQI